MWAERFDGDTSDLFALQSEITSRIAIALKLEVVSREAARLTSDPDTLDYILRGRAAYYSPPTRENYAEIVRLFEQALALDPRSVDAQSWLAAAFVGRVLDGMSETGTNDIARAEELVEQALAVAPRNQLVHFVKAQLLRATGRCEEAIREYQAVLASDRNWVAAIAHIGRCKIYIGPIEEAIPLLEQAIRLSPRDPNMFNWYYRIGETYLLQSRIDDAIRWLEKARGENEAVSYVHRYLAAAYALKGEGKRAAAELAEASKFGGRRSLSQLRATWGYETPEIRALAEATLIEGLRKAEMPEE